MSQDIEALDIYLSNAGVTRKTSVAATITSNTFSEKDGADKAHFPETYDSASEHTIAQDIPKSPNLFVVFSGLQIALFLAALDG